MAKYGSLLYVIHSIDTNTLLIKDGYYYQNASC